MDKRIIYENDAGGVSIVIPAPECGLTVEEIAAKDVPAGKPYKIVDVSVIPANRAARMLMRVTRAELTDGIGRGEAARPLNNGIDVEGTPV